MIFSGAEFVNRRHGGTAYFCMSEALFSVFFFLCFFSSGPRRGTSQFSGKRFIEKLVSVQSAGALNKLGSKFHKNRLFGLRDALRSAVFRSGKILKLRTLDFQHPSILIISLLFHRTGFSALSEKRVSLFQTFLKVICPVRAGP